MDVHIDYQNAERRRSTVYEGSD